MKIALLPKGTELQPISRRLTMEGDEIVDLEDAEFVIANKTFGGRLPAMKGGETFDQTVLEPLGFKVCEQPSDYFISRWYDPTSGWHPQIFLGIPLIGLMNNGQSYPSNSGCVGTYIAQSDEQNIWTPELVEFLHELRHSGFVSLHLSTLSPGVSTLELGIPGYGLYNIMEGLLTRLSEFLVSPQDYRFRESWTTSLVVTRFPFPHSLVGKMTSVGGIRSDIARHLLMFDYTRFKDTICVSGTQVCIVVNWARNLHESARLATLTASSLVMDQVQFRTDAGIYAGKIWGRVKESRFLDHSL